MQNLKNSLDYIVTRLRQSFTDTSQCHFKPINVFILSVIHVNPCIQN